MSPLQKRVLRILADRKQGLPLHQIADIVSQQTGNRIRYDSIGGAFSRNRQWLDSDNGRLNMHAIITISDEGRTALDEVEASHPLGPHAPGSFFVFIEEVHVIKRHTMVVQGVRDAAEAETVARRQCDEHMYPATMSVSIDRTYRVRQARQGHGV